MRDDAGIGAGLFGHIDDEFEPSRGRRTPWVCSEFKGQRHAEPTGDRIAGLPLADLHLMIAAE